MSTFALECPKCGSINTASTFILAKTRIKCGTCGEEINIKQSRLISKACPHCGKVFVCDQAKTKGKKCPSCGQSIDILQAATAAYKMTRVNCPQCACAVEVDQTKETYFCPVCDYQIDVKKELAKAKLVSDSGVSVIRYEGDNTTFVWKHPIEDFNLGSQLVVHESQEAVFFLNGEALDTFGPGRHTLETENLPVLKKIYSLPTDSQIPFHAEVYFINKAVQMGMKWGTDSRVSFIDPVTGIPFDIGASGEMNLQVSDSRKLLFKLVGTVGGLSAGGGDFLPAPEKGFASEEPGSMKAVLSVSKGNSGQILKGLRAYFRAPLMTEIKSYLAAVIKEQHINILEIDAHMGALSEALRARISPKLEEYGLTIAQFYITNIALPENDKNFKDMKALISQAYIGVRAEEVQASIAQAAQRRRLLEEQTEAQLRLVRAQGEAEAAKTKGLAEAEVMQAKGYSEKDVLAADVQKAYAEGMGKMGSSGGGSGGGIASDLIGLMAGMKMAGSVFDRLDGVMPPAAGQLQGGLNVAADEPGTAQTVWVCSCGENANTKKFCMNCGRPKPEPASAWVCPVCGARNIASKFCPECGNKRPG